MRSKPKICLVDADIQVKKCWELSLNTEAELHYYDHPRKIVQEARKGSDFLSSFECLIIGRYVNDPRGTLDILNSDYPEKFRELGLNVLFLNWQGYLTKQEIEAKFDGRLFNRYGVRWQTLRVRIQKVKSKLAQLKKTEEEKVVSPKIEKKQVYKSKPERCQELLLTMAKNAQGRHREKLEFYAKHDQSTGEKLLEAIYDKLLVKKEDNQNCPSQFINSSPVVAKNILKTALYS